MRKNKEKDFKLEEYEEFYEDHYFAPLPDDKVVHAHRLMPRIAWALDVAKEVKPKRILDLGCLEGYTLLTILNHVGGSGVGVDLSKDGVEIGTRHAKKNELDAVFLQSSVEDFMENTEEKYDFIVAFELLEHVKDDVKFLELIDKVKTDDATVLISTPAFESPTFGMDDEKNKCHIRLYTLREEDYHAVNSYGNKRKATSIIKAVGKDRIKDGRIVSELINLRYE